MRRIVFLVVMFVLLQGVVCGQTYTLNAALNGQTITTCSGTFYDSGGPNGDYGSSQNYTVTFVSSTPGLCIQVQFTSFYLESATWDYMIIYDGNTTGGRQLGKFGGSTSPGTVVSSTGALTFVFHSDGSVQYSGWSATISCVDCPTIGCNPQSTSIGSPCSPNGIHAFCTEDNDFNMAYPSISGSQNASSFLGSSSYGCLYSTPRPSWYYLQIESPGNLLIYIESRASVLPNGQPNPNSADRDIDFACWGPFEAQSQEDFIDNLCCGYYSFTDSDLGSHRPDNGNHNNNMGGYPDGNMIDCSYNAASTEWCYIPNAQPGQWYLLLICNYSSSSGYFGFTSQPTGSYGGGQATTNCNLLAPISYNNPLCEGDTLVLTCTNPITGATYNWSGPNGWSAITQVPAVSIPDVTVANSGQYTLQITGTSQSVNASHVDVSVHAMPQVSITANHDTICSGSNTTLHATGANSYSWTPGGATSANRTVSPTTTTTYTVVGTSAGCASASSITITVFQTPSVTVSTQPSNAVICKGDTATLYATGAETYQWILVQDNEVIALADSVMVAPLTNTSYRVIATSAEGCTKSVTRTVTVRPLPDVSISGADQVCLEDSVLLSAFPNGSAYTYLWSTGANSQSVWVAPTVTSDYEVVVANNYGCTSSAVHHVTLFTAQTWLYRDTICWNESYQDSNFNTHGILIPGNYRYDTLYQTVASCDSLVSLELVVLPMPFVILYDTACGSYLWRGNTYFQSGTYVDSLNDERGCLQIDTLHLVINQSVSAVDTVVACDTYTWLDGNTYTQSTNTPTVTLMTSTFCDSIVSLQLTVNHTFPDVLYKDTCSFYSWHGTVYNATGIYQYPTVDEHGCPRTDTLVLTIHNPSPASMSAQSCDSYMWNGTTYYESGVYTYGHNDGNGCWQVDTLYLSITPPVHLAENVTACESYEWHGVTNMQSGTFVYAHTDANNCMQVDTLHLTIYNAVPVVERVIVCEPYTWHGVQHDVTGTYMYNYNDAHNCPCVDTLHLTVTTQPEILLNTVMAATCNQANGSIKVDVSGGTVPYRYVFLPDEEEASFNGLEAGFYHLRMIDSIGCFADLDFLIENIIHQVNLVNVEDAHCGKADGTVSIAASGGFGEFTYQWPSPIVSTTTFADHVPAGWYSVEVVDSNGCSLSLDFRVKDIPGPDACFAFSTTNEQQVTFINCTSQGVTSWFWSFGDGHTSTEWQPSHTYHSPGEYPVMLTVEDGNQCVDSLSLLYVIKEVTAVYLPSSFVPESDIAENRIFKPFSNSIIESHYEMMVYDRWGQLIFVSHHPDLGWDGRINGQLAPQGTYTYRIVYQDSESKPGMVNGSVLLLRGY